MSDVIVSPSLLSADFGRLNEEIDLINESDADWLHIDVTVSYTHLTLPTIA